MLKKCTGIADAALPEGKLTHVLEGEDPLEAMAAAARAGLVTRIKASIEASVCGHPIYSEGSAGVTQEPFYFGSIALPG